MTYGIKKDGNNANSLTRKQTDGVGMKKAVYREYTPQEVAERDGEDLELFELYGHRPYLRGNMYIWCKRCRCALGSIKAMYVCMNKFAVSRKMIAPLTVEYEANGKKLIRRILP